MVIPSMLCFSNFLTNFYRFPCCFRMFLLVFLQLLWVFLLFPLSVSLVSCFRFCGYFGPISEMLQGFKEKIPVHFVKCFFLVKRYHCCLNLVSVCIGHYVPIQLQVFTVCSGPIISSNVGCILFTRNFVYVLLS